MCDSSRRLFRAIVCAVREALECGVGEMNLAIREVHGRTNVPTQPQILSPIKLIDTEKVLLSTSPQTSDGNPYEGPLTWGSSDPAAVAIEPDPATNGRTAWALTPLETGSATITVSAPGVRTAKVDISYAPPAVGEMNLSAGTPVVDTE